MQTSFICAGNGRGSLQEPVCAPYLRRSLWLSADACRVSLRVCGLGLYRLYWNGCEVTRGHYAPYFSNTDEVAYYDEYELSPAEGENVIALCLGNGFQNAMGGYTWDFDTATFQSEPKVAVWGYVLYRDGHTEELHSDERFVIHPSPIVFNDLWCGEYYDATKEVPGWNLPGLDTADWKPAVPTEAPRGELRLRGSLPIVCEKELQAVSITPCGEGYLYDFGENNAGVCRLCIHGEKGQIVTLIHGEYFADGKLHQPHFLFVPEEIGQVDRYTLKGEGTETFTPGFTYHGFRYVLVIGITAAQATSALLTYRVLHADLRERAGFDCSDPTAVTLCDMTRRATLSNFYHFPTDCPHREKNGWTGDAALSAEQTVLQYDPETTYAEWLYTIVKAQRKDGCLPGIIPTGGWGMGLGGPAWDAAIVELPYEVYRYRGDLTPARVASPGIARYIDYLWSVRNEDGLIAFGIGDWCPVDKTEPRGFRSPVAVTDTFVSLFISRRAHCLFEALGQAENAARAAELETALAKALMEQVVDTATCIAKGSCQTSQALLVVSDLLTGKQQEKACEKLVEIVEQDGSHMDVGIIGGRVLFHALTRAGATDLAYRMITTPEYPSYGHWIRQGFTTLCENFLPDDTVNFSHNHHMWGDITSWFIKVLAGIRVNPTLKDPTELRLCPTPVQALSHASGWHESPFGRVELGWKRDGDAIVYTLQLTGQLHGFCRINGQEFPVSAGHYRWWTEPDGAVVSSLT